MSDLSKLLQDIIGTGALAGVSTTIATALCGDIEDLNAAAPVNAVSHIAWGERAANQNAVSWQYTGLGVALNLAAVTSWAAVNEVICTNFAPRRDVKTAITTGLSVAALAWITDYYLVPKRLTPGFEKRVSNRSLFAIYSTLAVSLAVGRLTGRS